MAVVVVVAAAHCLRVMAVGEVVRLRGPECCELVSVDLVMGAAEEQSKHFDC